MTPITVEVRMRERCVLWAAVTAGVLLACDGDEGGGADASLGGDAGHPRDGALTDALSDAAAGEYLTPGDPGTGDVSFTVHTGEARHAISPYIYGVNTGEWDGVPEVVTLWRFGGNRISAYNWENNASNAGADWYHQNDDYLGGGDTPGEAVRSRVAAAHGGGAAILVSLPMMGYVAADKLADGDVGDTPSYLTVRFRRTVPAKGSAFAYPPDLDDDTVYQDEFVHWLEAQFPGAHGGGSPEIFYALDNEPDLWSSTHPRPHPDPATYAELAEKSTALASAVKDAAPGARVFGPVSYGWQGMVDLQSAPDAGGRDFLDFYLESLAAASATAGHRLLDVLDVHWYPEAQGGGQRITVDDAGPEVAEARMQAPRSLWDPTYTEDSWIAEWGTQGPIRLLPRLREQIAAGFPGTRIALTEYYYGGGADVSGGIAQADVLGVLGREDVFAALLWRLGETDHAFIWGAFRLFLDFDGSGGRFGDTSVAASTDDDQATAVYASIDGGDPTRVKLVAVNRTASDLVAALRLTHTQALGRVEGYRISAASATPAPIADLALTHLNAVLLPLPAYSATTLIIGPGT
jgi:hypothetical protein